MGMVRGNEPGGVPEADRAHLQLVVEQGGRARVVAHPAQALPGQRLGAEMA